MTEGIIQKVFQKAKDDIPYGWYKPVIDRIDQLQQELIEEIRKQSNDPNSELYYDERSLKALIGDKP